MITDCGQQKAEVVKITSRKNRFVHMTTCVTHTFVLVHVHNTCASGFSLLRFDAFACSRDFTRVAVYLVVQMDLSK